MNQHFHQLLGTVRVRTRIRSSHSEGDFNSLPPEPQQGNVEYKLKLVNPTSQRLEHLVTQMKWRLREGQGEAIYEIGVEDNGLMTGLNDDDMISSIETLREMARRLEATIQVSVKNFRENAQNTKLPLFFRFSVTEWWSLKTVHVTLLKSWFVRFQMIANALTSEFASSDRRTSENRPYLES